MSSKPKSYILDAWTILAFFEDNPAAERIANLIADAHEKGISLCISAITAGDVWSILAKVLSEHVADQCIKDLVELGVQIIPVDYKLAYQAAQINVANKIAYPSCFPVALGVVQKGSVLVTGDEKFKSVEGRIKIHWLN